MKNSAQVVPPKTGYHTGDQSSYKVWLAQEMQQVRELTLPGQKMIRQRTSFSMFLAKPNPSSFGANATRGSGGRGRSIKMIQNGTQRPGHPGGSKKRRESIPAHKMKKEN